MTQTIFNHNILPESAQILLKSAAKVQGQNSREEAIDAATKAIRLQNPHLFQVVPIVELPETNIKRITFPK